MKNVTLFSFILLVIFGCDIISSENNDNFGHCDKELFQSVSERNSLRLIIRYDMEYEREVVIPVQTDPPFRSKLTPCSGAK